MAPNLASNFWVAKTASQAQQVPPRAFEENLTLCIGAAEHGRKIALPKYACPGLSMNPTISRDCQTAGPIQVLARQAFKTSLQDRPSAPSFFQTSTPSLQAPI